mmetsp:Transcript_76875/g.94341  ORF Transcript_76875/g.94341 Transcript_76875/m.94341 type:complete len:355 (+) Transcript_76875:88-1152(+)
MEDIPVEPKKGKATKPDIKDTSIYRNYFVVGFVGFLQIWLVCVSIGMLYPTLTVPNIVEPNREFSTKKFGWMNNHRNDKWESYGYIVAMHAISGGIGYVFLFPPLLSVKGGYWHIILGKIAMIVFCLWLITPTLQESIYISNRGFNACQYTYNSFNIFITLQFIPWYMWLAELTCYGHTTVVYKTGINGSKYAKKSLKYFLMYLSITSIVYCLIRTPVLIIIIADKTSRNCLALWEILLNGASCLVDLGGITWSYFNIKYIHKSFDKSVTDDDWKKLHGRNMVILFTLMTFMFLGLIIVRLSSLIYSAILYVILIPIMLIILKLLDKNRNKLRRASNIEYQTVQMVNTDSETNE